jgi:hypothetical protein
VGKILYDVKKSEGIASLTSSVAEPVPKPRYFGDAGARLVPRCGFRYGSDGGGCETIVLAPILVLIFSLQVYDSQII